jgi:enoyl-CoA hydratase/carnithine racemase
VTYESVLLRHDDAVTTVTINRPPLNTVTTSALRELVAVFDEIDKRAETRCVVLTGSGNRAFCAGASLDDKPKPGGDRDGFRGPGRALIQRIETFRTPVVAAIRGWAIGGGFAISQACDVRIASETAKFRTGDAYVGIVPSWGISLVRLVHYIGRNRTLDMLMLGEDIAAPKAYEFGLITRWVPEDKFDAEIAAVAARIASGAPLVHRSVKEAVYAQYYEGPPSAAQVETRWADATQFSHDAQEGIAAFKERRKPRFEGR